MTPIAWLTMAVICSVVWGGFLGLLFYAMRREGERTRAADGGDDPS